MYKQRVKIFLAIMVLALAALVARLWQLQIIHGQEFRSQFEESLKTVELLPSLRGQILDRSGQYPLAINKPGFDLCLDYGLICARVRPDETKWMQSQQGRIKRAEGVSFEEAERILDRRVANTWDVVERISQAEGIDLDRKLRQICSRVESIRSFVGVEVGEERQAHAVIEGLDEQTNLTDTIGVSWRRSQRRWYPQGSLACHLIGIMGQVDANNDLKRQREAQAGMDKLEALRAGFLSGETIGKSGVEKLCEDTLRGRKGYVRLKKGRPQAEVLEEEPAEHGKDVRLTIDLTLQRELTDVMVSRGLTGSIVVIDIPTGQVLALVSVPTYDLNDYRKDYSRLLHETVMLPLRHRAVAGLYPPGSTAKPIAGLAALGAGKIDVNTEIVCRGYLHQPNAFRCWVYGRYGGSHGPLNVTGALKNSCNVFFYTTGEMLGLPALHDWFGRFGYTSRPGTGLSDEVPGQIRRTGTVGSARLAAIGQGPLLCTPLHVANAFAAIARSGRFISPQVVIDGGPKPLDYQIEVSQEAFRAVQQGMYEVVNEPGGTAYKVFQEAKDEHFDIAGKTGTADVAPQWIDENGNDRFDPQEVVRSGNMAWFAGFAPYRKPAIAFAVQVEYVPGHGAETAGPVAIEVARTCRKLGLLP